MFDKNLLFKQKILRNKKLLSKNNYEQNKNGNKKFFHAIIIYIKNIYKPKMLKR